MIGRLRRQSQRTAIGALLAVLLAPAVRADAPKQPAWEKFDEADGIAVYRRDVPGSPIVALRGEGLVNAPILRVASVLIDSKRAPESIDSLAESRTIRHVSETEYVEWDHIATPFVLKDRDFVFNAKLEIKPKQKQVRLDYHSVNDPDAPKTDYVRGQFIYGTFALTSVDGGKRTRVLAEVLCDPKGSVAEMDREFVPKELAPQHRHVPARTGEEVGHQGRPEAQSGARAPGVLKALGALVRCLLCVLFVCALAGRAAADDARQRVVLLTREEGARAQLLATLDATRTLLAELRVELLLSSRGANAELGVTTALARDAVAKHDALAAVWLENEPGAVVVYFYERAQARLLTRRVEVSESEAAAAEEVAVVLRSAVAAALEGAEVMMTEVAVPEPPKPPAPPPLLPPPAPPPARPQSRAELSAGYLGGAIASQAPWQSGAHLGFGVAPASSPLRAGLGCSLFQALTVDGTTASADLSRAGADAWFGAALGDELLELRPELGVLVEWVRRSTSRTAPTVAAEPASTRWLWGLSARLRGQLRLSSALRLYAAAGAQWLPVPFEERALGPTETETLLAFAPLRPVAEAGLSLRLW
ncbi:MAG: hypothetical protein QM756_01270 [Polyangiaceae bacterium]